MSGPQISDESFNRLTRMAEDAGAFLERHLDALPSDRAIIIIEDDGDVGSMLNGYPDIFSVVITLLQMVNGLCQSAGRRMQVEINGDMIDL